MRALQSIVLFIMINDIFDGMLLIVASFIDSFFGKSWSDDIELAKMPSTKAVLTAAVFLIMMREVIISQMMRSFREKLVLPFVLF